MIEINLLPEELRLKRKTEGFDVKYALYALPLAFVVLIAAHIYLFAFQQMKNMTLSSLERTWKAMEPQRKSLEALKKESSMLLQDVKVIQDLSLKRITWADKLNKLSLYLPSGVWFTDISITSKDFILKGSVISLDKDELTLINNFLDRLKADKAFFNNFENIELSSIERRGVGSYEVADFTLNGKLKTK